MKKMLLAFAGFGFLASSAQAATLSKTSYKTPQAAAKAGAAYHFSKALGSGRYHSRDMRIVKTLDKTAPTMKFRVQSSNGLRQKIVTVKKEGPGVYRAFLPNRNVFTPVGSGRL
jgi:hypothetical protein